MKQGSNNKRPRRGGAPKGNRGPVRNQTFDSNCSGQRVRGTAQQVMEKYLALARDAASSGDRILAENFYQHAEHYFRIANVNGALSNRIQQQGNGGHVPPTPAHDQTPLDDLFDYEEEAALQHQSSGHPQNRNTNGRDRDQQQSRVPEPAEGKAQSRDEQPASQPSEAEVERAEAGEQPQVSEQTDRAAKPRRPRTRRKAETVEASPEAGEAVESSAPPVPGAEDGGEVAAKPSRTRRTRKTAEKTDGEATASEEGEAPAPRRRRAPARKKTAAVSDTGSEDGGDSDRREVVA